jgi:hypothetical protein
MLTGLEPEAAFHGSPAAVCPLAASHRGEVACSHCGAALQGTADDDPLSAARGIALGLLLGAALWIVGIVALRLLLRAIAHG